jgi:uncharacterized protein
MYLLVLWWLAGCTAQQISNPEGIAAPYTNRLVEAANPYLRQHGYDPVNWRHWDQETLAEARHVQRPLLLVLGFSASYWCQRMHEQCYLDTEVADLMNRAYIPVLIDREARPDLDAALMAWCRRLGAQPCGWPLHVILTPEGEPIHVETYLDREAWMDLLARFDHLFQTQPAQIRHLAAEMRAQGELPSDAPTPASRRSGDLAEPMLTKVYAQLSPRHGGLRGSSKFLRGDLLHLLLTDAALRPGGASADWALLTLNRMADGAIYDQLGGGFFRYSSDEAWRHPQFEKMLSDQAMMVQAYARAYQLTRDPTYERITYETLACVERWFAGESGGYYASMAAFSEGEQGRYYLWPRIELDGVLGAEAEVFAQYYNLTAGGNWGRGQSILYRTLPDAEWARLLRQELPVFRDRMEDMRSHMWEARRRRLTPERDQKQITAWNALMTSAWVAAYEALGEVTFRERAVAAGEYLLRSCRSEAGGLVRYRLDGQGQGAGFLSDYAFTCQALLDLYRLTLDDRWVKAAQGLASFVITHFYDAGTGRFRLTEQAHRPLVRASEAWPQADGLPCPEMVMGPVLLTLHDWYDKPLFQAVALATLDGALGHLLAEPTENPAGVAWLLHQTQPSYQLLPPAGVSRASYERWLLGGYFPQVQILSGSQAEAWWTRQGRSMPEAGWWLCQGGACDSLGTVEAVLARLQP